MIHVRNTCEGGPEAIRRKPERESVTYPFFTSIAFVLQDDGNRGRRKDNLSRNLQFGAYVEELSHETEVELLVALADVLRTDESLHAERAGVSKNMVCSLDHHRLQTQRAAWIQLI